MDKATELRVKTLAEALPYIQKYSAKTFIVKYGGSALVDPEVQASTIKDLILLNMVGIRVILVHGGGPEINEMLSKIGKEIKFEAGLRKTDTETMEVVEMVLHGKVQRRLVSAINCAGARAIGLSGRDGQMMIARRHPKSAVGDWLGEIEAVDTSLLLEVMALGMIPVISSIAADREGNAYNINADIMAAEIAKALKADKLLLMTDTAGILRDKNDPSSLITELSVDAATKLLTTGVVQGGMIPKTECCIDAIQGGVAEAIILNGLNAHSLLLETFTDYGAGTLIRHCEP